MTQIEKTYGCGNNCRTNISGIVRCMNKYRQEIWHSVLLMIIYFDFGLSKNPQAIRISTLFRQFFTSGNFTRSINPRVKSGESGGTNSKSGLWMKSPEFAWNTQWTRWRNTFQLYRIIAHNDYNPNSVQFCK